ncbi:MAG TPA: VanZ family protein [Dissulfurispiraceae bacterium]|nr:VanZ family protein [Dissulfurispiraceae bacterium]
MKPSEIRYLVRYWLPVALAMFFIFFMSSGTFSATNTSRFIVPLLHFFFPDMTAARIDLIHALIRKCGHLAEYFILSFALFRAFRGESSKRWSLSWALWALTILIAFAFGDEFHQSFVPSRTASLSDVAVDVVGGMLAQLTIAGRGLIVRTGREFSR